MYTAQEQANHRNIVADALESGKYQQGHGMLHSIDCNQSYFCCLGVAIEVFISRGGKLIKDCKGDYYNYNDNSTFLPEEVRDWLGFTKSWGEYIGSSLVSDNDITRLTFKQIAEKFRNPPEGLCVQ